MQEYIIDGHEPSFLPAGEWELAWSDEFDGDELDTSKWDYRLEMMGKRHPAWTDKAVRIENGCAVIEMMIEDGRPVTSQLQTGYNFMDTPVIPTTFGNDHLQWNIGKLHENKFVHRYGYFECRCRLQQMPGWWVAFWVQSPVIGSSLDPATSGTELDIMESFQPGVVNRHNAFTGGYGLDMKRAFVGGKKLDEKEFHRFGMLWDETGYTFYIDGVEDGHIDQYISRIPEFILISGEPRGYRFADHTPTPEAYAAAEAGDCFLVDYVRVFDLKK